MKTSRIALMLVALVAASRANAQAPVFFDGFLFDNLSMPAEDYNGFFLWNVNDGSVDLVGQPLPSLLGRFVDLGGSTNNAGRFETKDPLPLLTPGTLYNLSFDYNSVDGNPNAALVTLGSHSFDVAASSTDFQRFDEDFVYSGPLTATLAFQDQGNDTAGIGVDNIRVALAIVIPEPQTLSLLIAAAVALACCRRTRMS